MTIWPFNNIPPELWASVAPEEKAMIEALTAAFIAEVERQRATGLRLSDPDR